METLTLSTEIRSSRGKGAARQLRIAEKIPAVLYGPGIEPTPLALSPKELTKVLSTDHGRNVVIKVEANGEHLAMVKDLQIHPVTRRPLHVDLYKVDPSRPVEAEVPFSTTGRAKGVVAGGDLKVTQRTVRVRCAPGSIPAAIVVDVADLDLNEAIKVKDIPLAEGVELLLDPERNLAAIVTAKKRPIKDGEEGEDDAEAAAD